VSWRRREVVGALGGIGAAALAGSLGASPLRAAATSATAPPVPFAKGDVVVGCTLLNDPADDHRGRGRILHYDSALQLKNTLWLDDTTHIVQGLRFAPDGTLWAFDAFSYTIARFAGDGRRLPNFTGAPRRSFAHITFHPDGRFFMGENFVGEKSRVPLKTTLPFMPGTQRLGDGHLFEFDARGKLLHQHPTRVHGGMGGFQALNSSALTPDGNSIVYTSESGPKVFRWDLVQRRQLPNVLDHPDNTGKFYFDLAFDAAQRLLVVAGTRVDVIDLAGKPLGSYALPRFGWASMSTPSPSGHVYLSNFFTGELAKLDLGSGRLLAQASTGIRKSASGIAEKLA
jgi:sugar lactone lactonase YvrE